MIKIGITGSLASGKTTASKIIASKRGPLFSADRVVKKLYIQNNFKKLIARKLNFKSDKNFKKKLKDKILQKKEMFIFLRNNKNKKLLFFEIPLLIESKLTKHFDVLIFIKSKKSLRLKRYILKGGSIQLFSLLEKHQIKDTKKMKFCDHIVVNNKSLSILKRKLSNIIKLYE